MNRWEGDTVPLVELVVSGLVRVFVTAPDGRTLTVRYCRPGALMGVFSVFVQSFVLPASTQALVDAELLQISPEVTRQLAARDGRVAMALLADLGERVQSFVAEIPGSAFTTRPATGRETPARPGLPAHVRAWRTGRARQPARSGGGGRDRP